jgi:hypothetical protein
MLPPEIRERTPAPHALRVALRKPEMPAADEVSAFLDAAPGDSGDAWFRISLSGRDTLLLLLEEGQGPGHSGFDHSLLVESGWSKACFLAAYFIARRCGGVIQIRQRASVLPAEAFAERYLDREDLDARWTRSVKL